MKSKLFFTLVLFLGSGEAMSVPLRVAVASNFTATMAVLVQLFEKESGTRVKMISGSTGKHFAQIKNGAPYDIFFAADKERPALLEQQGVAVKGSRFTYAVGRLVLWSPQEGRVDSAGDVLEQGDFRHLSIANPKHAPYGRAAKEVLESRYLWEKMQGRLVRGENISQAFQFVNSGNAEIGFIAFSQLKLSKGREVGSYWDIPPALYTAIEQQAVLLKEGAMARSFLSFIQSDQALMIIKDHGYGTE